MYRNEGVLNKILYAKLDIKAEKCFEKLLLAEAVFCTV